MSNNDHTAMQKTPWPGNGVIPDKGDRVVATKPAAGYTVPGNSYTMIPKGTRGRVVKVMGDRGRDGYGSYHFHVDFDGLGVLDIGEGQFNDPHHTDFLIRGASKKATVEGVLDRFAWQYRDLRKMASSGWAAVFELLDSHFPRWNANKVTDWNKVYAQFRGVTNDPGAAAHYYSEYRAGRMSQDEAIRKLKSEGVRAPSV